jgi:hypothetical protein
MRKIIDLALAAAFALAISASALADSRSAAEFALKTCLPAMDDVGKVEIMARENGWSTFAYNPTSESKSIASKSRWRADGFFVSTWIWVDDHLAHCVVGFLGKSNINRDNFFATISAALELKLASDKTRSGLRMETYELDNSPSARRTARGLLPPELGGAQLHVPDGMLDIPVTSKVRLNIASQLDGTMSSVLYSRFVSSPFDMIPDWARLS